MGIEKRIEGGMGGGGRIRIKRRVRRTRNRYWCPALSFNPNNIRRLDPMRRVAAAVVGRTCKCRMLGWELDVPLGLLRLILVWGGRALGREGDGETEKDNSGGMRGFMSSVRRISIGPSAGAGAGAGRHRKSKSGSGVSISGLHIGGKDEVNDQLGFSYPLSPPLSKTEGECMPGHEHEHEHELLPPIELHPPSPPQTIGKGGAAGPGTSVHVATGSVPLPSTSASSVEAATTSLSSTALTGSAPLVSPARRALAKVPGSPGQTSSLGRSSGVGTGGNGSGGIGSGGTGGVGVGVAGLRGDGGSGGASMLRRSSLGDLKIPERISQAQVNLRRDLGMVREFASNVERECLFSSSLLCDLS
jgi:hypothetical protein